jgi:hypothetical protein
MNGKRLFGNAIGIVLSLFSLSCLPAAALTGDFPPPPLFRSAYDLPDRVLVMTQGARLWESQTMKRPVGSLPSGLLLSPSAAAPSYGPDGRALVLYQVSSGGLSGWLSSSEVYEVLDSKGGTYLLKQWKAYEPDSYFEIEDDAGPYPARFLYPIICLATVGEKGARLGLSQSLLYDHDRNSGAYQIGAGRLADFDGDGALEVEIATESEPLLFSGLRTEGSSLVSRISVLKPQKGTWRVLLSEYASESRGAKDEGGALERSCALCAGMELGSPASLLLVARDVIPSADGPGQLRGCSFTRFKWDPKSASFAPLWSYALLINGTSFFISSGKAVPVPGRLDAVVNADAIKLRAKPGLDEAQVGRLAKGASARILDVSVNREAYEGYYYCWYKLALADGTVGWAYGAYLGLKAVYGQ